MYPPTKLKRVAIAAATSAGTATCSPDSTPHTTMTAIAPPMPPIATFGWIFMSSSSTSHHNRSGAGAQGADANIFPLRTRGPSPAPHHIYADRRRAAAPAPPASAPSRHRVAPMPPVRESACSHRWCWAYRSSCIRAASSAVTSRTCGTRSFVTWLSAMSSFR
jgi:hypothetical protein